MHDRLRNGGRRQMLAFDGTTAVLNTAVVPRHRPDPRAADAVQSHFTVAEFEGPELKRAEFVWVGQQDPDNGGAMAVLASQPLLREADSGSWEFFNTHTSEWQAARSQRAAERRALHKGQHV